MTKRAKKAALDVIEDAFVAAVPENLQQEVVKTIKSLKRDELLALNVFGMGLGYLSSRLRRRLSQEKAEDLLRKLVVQQMQVCLVLDPEPDEASDGSNKPS